MITIKLWNVEDFPLDKDEKVLASFTARAEYEYIPGCAYRRNGDPGDPPDEIFEIIDVDIKTIKLWNEKLQDYEEVDSKEYDELIYETCYDNEDKFYEGKKTRRYKIK